MAATLARESEAEIASALGRGARRSVLVRLLARVPSARLGRTLARFDAAVARDGIGAAAREVLASLGASVDAVGTLPASGAVLVVTNHPGAYDAFALMASLGRDDVAFLAADRRFLRALPSMASHLVFVDDTRAFGRLAGLRAALEWLRAGRVLVQFGAGAIEPDLRFTLPPGTPALGPWAPGTGVLASRAAALGASVVPVLVSGVHSPRVKGLRVVQWAERRGVTTLAPLLQATLPGFRDVSVSVHIGDALPSSAIASATPAVSTALVREAVETLARRRFVCVADDES